MVVQLLNPHAETIRHRWRVPALGAAVLLMVSACGAFGESDAVGQNNEGAERKQVGQPRDSGTEAAEDVDEGDAEEADQSPTDDSAANDDDEAEEHAERDVSEPIVVEDTVWDFDAQQDVDVEVTIYPFMRDSHEGQDFISGNITYEVTSEEGEFALDDHGTAPGEVRLLDPENPEILYHPTVVSAGGDVGIVADVERDSIAAGEEPVRWASIYTDPGTNSTAVLLPYFGLITDVGIVDGEELSAQDYITFGQAEGLDEISLSNFSIDVYRERADGDINIRDEDGQAVITLDAEILFDSDEYEIRDDADDALLAAADELERAAEGELLVVGHTDNIDTEEYNQALSENRAEAVRNRLDELTELDEFDAVATEGRSLREPIATNETDEGRQMNRRVELYFTPAELDEIDEADVDSGELPEAQGPVGEADEPITVTAADGRAAEVSIESLERLGELLVGRLTVEITDTPDGEDDAGPLAWPVSFGTTGARQDHEHELNPGTQTDALTLLIGDQRVFPLEYMGETYFELGDDGEIQDAEDPWYLPLADRGFGLGADAEVGTQATTTVLWPSVPGETVTIDVPGETEHSHRPYTDPFRINDVPIVEGGTVSDG